MLKRRREIVAALVGSLLFMGLVGWSVHWAFGRIIKTNWVSDAILKIQRLDRNVSEVESQLEILGECMVRHIDVDNVKDVSGLEPFLDEAFLLPLNIRELLLRNLKTKEKIFLKGTVADDLSENVWRGSLLDSKLNRTPISALELTEFGPRIVSLIPIADSDWVVELSADLKNVLGNYARREGCDVVMLMPVERWGKFEGKVLSDSKGRQWGVVMSTHPEIQNYFEEPKVRRMLGSGAFGMLTDGSQHYGMVMLDGVEYQSVAAPRSSDQEASFFLWSDYTGVVHGYIDSARGIILTLWLTAAFFGALVGYFGLKYRRQAKAKIQESMDKLIYANQTLKFEAQARQRAEEKLRGVAESIYQGRCEDQAVLSQLAHHLKVSASGIIGFSTLNRQNAKTAEASESALEFIKAGIQILHQAENLDAWAQRDFYKSANSPTNMALADLVHEATKSMKEWREYKRISIDFDLDEEAMVRADEYILSLALKNLISNAIKYSPLDERVKVSIRCVSDGVQLTIVDKGNGISPEKMANLFTLGADRLAPGSAGEEGVGMGLVLVKWACDIMQAKFRMITDVGQGCRVVVTFPAVAAEPHRG